MRREVLLRAALAFVPPVAYLWSLPLLSAREFAGDCEGEPCHVSQYIDTAAATGALWLSITPLALLMWDVTRAIDATALTLLMALQLLFWGLFTMSPYRTHMGRHNAALFAWIVCFLSTMWYLVHWTRARTGAWPRGFVALATVASAASVALPAAPWTGQSAAVTLLIGSLVLWYVRNAHLLPHVPCRTGARARVR